MSDSYLGGLLIEDLLKLRSWTRALKDGHARVGLDSARRVDSWLERLIGALCEYIERLEDAAR